MSGKMLEVCILSGMGVYGSGFKESSLDRSLEMRPHFIGCDCGSTDLGPAPLGSGKTAFPRQAIKRDFRLMLKAARRVKIPLLLGSAGTAGGEPHLELFKEIILEIAATERLSFPPALIHAEQDRAYLKKRFREGRIKPLKPVPPFDEAVIDRSVRIVGMMGAEPFLRALDNGAEVVIAGRASD